MTADPRPRYGPGRGELWFRLVVGLLGLLLVGAAVAIRGVSSAPALVEVIGIAGLFFGGSSVWAGWRLWRMGAER